MLLTRHVPPLQWRHNWRDNVSNHQPHHCLLNRSFRLRSKKTSTLRVTALRAGNSLVTGKFPAQMARNAENISIWWRHHVTDTYRLWQYLWRGKGGHMKANEDQHIHFLDITEVGYFNSCVAYNRHLSMNLYVLLTNPTWTTISQYYLNPCNGLVYWHIYASLDLSVLHDDVIKWKHFPRTGPLCGEFTGRRWIPLTKCSDVELWCFVWSEPE